MEPFYRKKITPSEPQKPSFSQKSVPQSDSQKRVQVSLVRKMMRWVPKNKSEYQQKKVPFFLMLVTLFIAFGIIFKVTYTAYQYVVHFDTNDLLAILSSDLQTDDKGRTNLLLLGTGGEGHDGGDLTDTIIVASLNNQKNTLSMLSIPRDLWLNLPGYGSSRINKIYENLKGQNGSEQALEILKTGVENITNVSIPYYAKIDFQGFTEMIDTLGGINILVEKSIYDTTYPTPDGGYETFSIEAGEQHLDGETALKYARSRHTTSDFDRAKRQQQILNAIKEKAQQTDYLSSPLLLKKLYDHFSENIETNLSVTELISLADFAKDFDQESITTAVLKDIDIIDVGSFLYTPERELYGGAFVLIPIGNTYDAIQRFIRIVFDYPLFFQEDSTIQILNGTRRGGLAATLGQKMLPYGFNVQRYDNADRKDYEVSHYYIHRPENTRVTDAVLQNFLPNAVKMKGNPPDGIDTSYDISIILGEDFSPSEI